MADLFSVTAPLLIRRPDGVNAVMAECFRHPRGVLYFDLFWNLGDPAQTVHLVEGELKGDGPWKIGAAVVRVLGCHGTDADLAADYAQWTLYQRECAAEYPPRAIITAIARAQGVLQADTD